MGLTGDLGSVVIIIFIITLVNVFLALSIGLSNVQNNWQKYKCNPLVMPFASFFGYDPITNFDQCIQTQQSTYMQNFLNPIYSSLEQVAQQGAIFTQLFESNKELALYNQDTITSLSGNVNERINAIINESLLLYNNISDTFSKLASTITIFYYSMKGFINISDAAWQELPGTIIRVAGDII